MLKINKKAVAIAALVILTLVLRPSIITSSKKVLFEVMSYPLRAASNIKNYFATRTMYAKENYILKQKLALISMQFGKTSSILKENERLRGMLAFKKRLPYKSVGAEVIGRVPSTWTSSVIINKGTSHGISKNMAVCTANGLVGTVVEVGPNTSKVMLITDYNSRIGVILEASRQIGVMVGNGRGEARVIYLGLDSEIKNGENILTSALGGVLPEGIQIGSVKKVDKDPVGLYKFAVVKPNQDLNSIEEVICIR